jgi:hypothetical protein
VLGAFRNGRSGFDGLEPGLVRDVGWAGQRVLEVVGGVSGTTLTISSGSFFDAGVEQGHVVVFNNTVLEVVSVESPTSATVSMMRASSLGDPVPGANAPTGSVDVWSFTPQIGLIHRQVLAMIGIDPDGGGVVDEGAVTNPRSLVTLEALGALHLIYAAAGAPGRGGVKFNKRAETYRNRFANERERVVAMIDLDGDGIADVARRPNVFVLSRG